MKEEDWDIKLLDYITGEVIDEKERRKIELWIAENDKNRAYFEQIQIDYLRQRWFFRSKLICRKEPLKLRSRRRHLVYITSVAASLLLLAGFFVLRNGEERVPVMKGYAGEMITPGTFKAKLLLSSGQEVVLTKGKGEIREQAKVRVLTNESGELVYQPQEDTLQEEVYNTLSVERGCEYKVNFSDGSVAWVNSATEIEYPIVFLGDKRVVKLKGEAYFQIKSDAQKPFVVLADGVEVKVTGTEFNVNTHWHNSVETVLVKGEVYVKKDSMELQMRPSQRVVYDPSKNEMYKEDVNVEKYIAWKNGDFIFSEERLEDIMDKLSLWYDCHVFFKNQALKEERLSGDMKKYGKIEELLHFFESSMDVKFKIEGKTIIVENK
ncbi:FecR family protein [Sanguibacteroides justesenii]|uniref:Uncharacterized protein n=1 Tax=Sanguibacteroides justesenii TaxID=1547597 RepID=A0A0C3RDQ8_9PORP|nr:FecR family protein [Sanguibacteroides justesenii]KIO42969.1 hypothetical protein BA92_14020 [Sanguibacteroides justesenii]PXZ44289.1 FecR family protein [Sanguibacteroides justesenii]